MDASSDGSVYVDFARYQASVRRYKRRMRMQALRRRLTMTGLVLGGIGIFVGIVWCFAVPPQQPRLWSIETGVRHVLAAARCDGARGVGLASAYRGEPGYWRHLDADNDGVACEPWPRW